MANDNKCCELKNCANNGVTSSENKVSLVVQECIKNVVKSECLQSYTVEVKDISTNGGNYLALLQTVDIKGKGADDENKEINLFVKNAIETDGKFDHFEFSDMYFRESFIYKEVLKMYEKLQDEYNVPNEERFNIVKSYSEVNSEAIILENVVKKGFETSDRRDVTSLKFAELSLMQLARYHALSFVLQEKHPRYFEKNVKNMKSILNEESDWDTFLKKMFNVAVASLEGEARMKLESYRPKLVKKYKEYYIMANDPVCLCHGDYRANNILQKTVDGVVTEVFPIDYQLTKHSSPVLDFVYFIIGATDQEFRDAHMNHLKDLYYKSFERFLGYFDIRSDDVYSRKRFERDLSEKWDYGIVLIFSMLPFLFVLDDDVPDINDLFAHTEKPVAVDKRYGERVRELVDFFMKEGYL